MACPICKSKNFYTKNPDDDFDIYEFKWEDGRIQYEDDDAEDEAPKIKENPEIFCQLCSWHGKISTVE